VLEHRFPVRLESYAIRAGSGGKAGNAANAGSGDGSAPGGWDGGDGGVRRVRFLEAMTASILSNGRKTPGFGVGGGRPGALGINRVERADGRVETLAHADSTEMQPGDVFVIETPGGGGAGRLPR
jgi:5-oxoprolinase (ATP-hydrolysing)